MDDIVDRVWGASGRFLDLGPWDAFLSHVLYEAALGLFDVLEVLPHTK